MRTIKEFIDNKYAKNEMGKESFDKTVLAISEHIISKHTASDGLDKTIVDTVGGVARDRNALNIEGALGVTSFGASIVGGGAIAVGSEDVMLRSLGLAGATCAGIMLIGYIKDRLRYNKSKSQLKSWVRDELDGDITTPEMSDRAKDACLGEVCESLVDEFVMEMK